MWCTRCGKQAQPEAKVPFTRLDDRYDLGKCECSPGDTVQLVNDPIQAEILAHAAGGARPHPAEVERASKKAQA